MPKYKANWDLRSSYGELQQGKEYTLTEQEAEDFNRDSPGIIEKVKERKTQPKQVATANRGSPAKATKQPVKGR